MRHGFRSIGIVSAFLIAVTAVSPARSAALFSAITYNFWDASGHESIDTSLALSSSSPTSPDSFSVSVQTDYGVQKGQVKSAWFGGGTERLQYGGGNINSSWTDSFVVSGGTGTGIATFQTLIDGSLEFSPLSFLPAAEIILRIRGFDQATNYVKQIGRVGDIESWQGTSFSGGILTRQFEFTYGTPFELQSDLFLSGDAGGLAIFGSTVVAGLILPEGAALTTDSGALYAPLQAIPEPKTYVLLCLGMGVLVLARRRYSRS